MKLSACLIIYELPDIKFLFKTHHLYFNKHILSTHTYIYLYTYTSFKVYESLHIRLFSNYTEILYKNSFLIINNKEEREEHLACCRHFSIFLGFHSFLIKIALFTTSAKRSEFM